MDPWVTFGATHLDPARPGGFSRYTTELLHAMRAQAPNTRVYAAAPTVRDQFGDDVRLVGPGLLARSDTIGNAARLVWNQTQLPRLLRQDGSSVFYSPVPEGSLISSGARQVVTVHDLLPLIFPQAHPRLRHYYRVILPRILKASAAVITVSEATRRDLQRTCNLGDRPVHVVYQGYRSDVFAPAPAAEVARVQQRYGLSRYILAVGDARAHKNVAGLISAFLRLRPEGVELAVVGVAGPEKIMGNQGAAALEAHGPVRFLGAVPDRDLAALYSGALALVFPSLYEGFGIPPLEAMACGCPVVVSRVASLPEVCGDAALYVDPARPESLAAGVEKIASDEELRVELRGRGIERARGFSYADAARRLLDILGDVDRMPAAGATN